MVAPYFVNIHVQDILYHSATVVGVKLQHFVEQIQGIRTDVPTHPSETMHHRRQRETTQTTRTQRVLGIHTLTRDTHNTPDIGHTHTEMRYLHTHSTHTGHPPTQTHALTGPVPGVRVDGGQGGARDGAEAGEIALRHDAADAVNARLAGNAQVSVHDAVPGLSHTCSYIRHDTHVRCVV